MKIWQKLLAVSFSVIFLSIFLNKAVFAAECCSPGSSYVWNQATNSYMCLAGSTFIPIQCLVGEVCDTSKVPYTCKNAASVTVTATPGPTAPVTATVVPTTSPYDPCKNDASGNCNACKDHGTWTAIGCLENEPASLVGQLIGIGGGIAGGIAFLLMLWGAAQLVLSQGIPEKIQGAKDTITSAVIGLVFIFLSVLILKLIGVQILGIPGWS